MAKVLVIAPHADDEILGCGGSIAKHIRMGDDVYVAVMTNAAEGAPELFTQQQVKEVRDEAKLSHKYLGVKETIWFDFPAPQLEQFPQYKIASAINSLIQKLKIEVLYIPHKGDLHMDHGAVYNASLVAARPVPGQCVKKILAYETLSETEWGHPTVAAVFIPTFFNTLKETDFNHKLGAMNFFASQLKPFPNARSIRAIEHLAALRGAYVGHDYAEAFMLIRDIH
jgi:N-acetylglucosamine malate deacetylase 1